MMTNTKLRDGYESPEITVIEAETEKGFAISGIPGVDPSANGNDMPWVQF